MNPSEQAKSAIHVQDEIYRWIESQCGIIDGNKSGLRMTKGQISLVIEATINEQKFRIEKLIDDYPDQVLERIKEVVLGILDGVIF